MLVLLFMWIAVHEGARPDAITGMAAVIAATYVTSIGQLLMLGAQTPAGRRMALQALTQALVQQDGAGIERRAANEANMLFEGNV